MRRAALILLAVLPFGGPASATLRRVPSVYPTIQSGINAASIGDTVLVADGTYTGVGNRDVDFLGKTIVVLSEHGAASTVVDCQGSAGAPHRGFLFHTGETNAAVLDGFAIENGHVRDPMNGGGIECENASPTIRSCIVRDCTVAGFGCDGGGICCRSSSARIEDCQIFRNFASYGGGIACRGSLLVTILRCTVTGNSANHGGGIDAGGIGAPRIVGCVISGNDALGGMGGNPSGGGLLLGGQAIAEDCVVTGNRSAQGGGVTCVSGTPSILGCTIAANRAIETDGGGVYAVNTSVGIDRTILWDNCAAAAGDDIDAGAGGSISFGCCIVDPLGIAQSGGVVHDLGDNLDLDPLFCLPVSCLDAPTSGGSFSVGRSSPAFPDANPCGAWIGALRVGCPAAEVLEIPGNRSASRLEVFPNPATDHLHCRFYLQRAGRIRLSLFDAAGRCLEDLVVAEMPAGAQEAGFPLSGETRRRLPRGTYFLRLDGPGVSVERPIVLTP